MNPGRHQFKCCPLPCQKCGDITDKLQQQVEGTYKVVKKRGDSGFIPNARMTLTTWLKEIDLIEDVETRECVREFMLGRFEIMKRKVR